jgi:asparagine synthase (glutamine-hydrolysing)
VEVARLVERSVADSLAGETMVAVSFSGGLDSSILAKCTMGHTHVVACTAFARGAVDGVRARDAAAAMGVDLVATELNAENVGEALAELELPFVPSLMDRSLWCLYSIVAKSAHATGAGVLLLGQLADELFGGYAKYAEALRTEGEGRAKSMMGADFREYARRGKVRDVAACAPWVQARFPFESERLVEFASSLPMSYKIRGGARKAVLRRAASILGVPEGQAEAAKKAAQYSSGVQKLVAASPF